jgi:replicative DNA helicase
MKLTDTYPALGVLADNYARAVHEQGQRAQLASAAVRMTQIVNSDLDMDEMVDLLEQAWVETLASAHAEPGWKPIDGLSTVNEFVTGSDEVHEWVIPGLLERQERLMLVAPEKAGKSVLTRQVALMLAAGRHPFSTSSACPPMTTLMIDLENPAPTARRDFRRQIDALEGLWSTENDRAYLWHKPAGIHLGDRADRVALFQVVERVQPDLLCICPIYKAYDGLEQSWEQQAQGVQKPLDRLREEFNLALWLEHHAPWGEKGMREIRAIGSSRWARWLDYQVSLEPTGSPPYQRLTWKSVRRDERKMAPASLVRGGPGEPSWIPEWADGGNLGFDLAIHESEL